MKQRTSHHTDFPEAEIEKLIKKAISKHSAYAVHPKFRVRGSTLFVYDVNRRTFRRTIDIIRTKFPNLYIRCEHTYFQSERYPRRGTLLISNVGPFQKDIGARLRDSIAKTFNESCLSPEARALVGQDFALTTGTEYIKFWKPPSESRASRSYQGFFEPDGLIRFMSEDSPPSIAIDILSNAWSYEIWERAENLFRCADGTVRLVIILNIESTTAAESRGSRSPVRIEDEQYLPMLDTPSDGFLGDFSSVPVSVLDLEPKAPVQMGVKTGMVESPRWLAKHVSLFPRREHVCLPLSWNHVMRKSLTQYLSERGVEESDERWQNYHPSCKIDFEGFTDYLFGEKWE